MTEWQWKVIQSIIRLLLGVMLKHHSPQAEDDIDLINEALQRDKDG